MLKIELKRIEVIIRMWIEFLFVEFYNLFDIRYAISTNKFNKVFESEKRIKRKKKNGIVIIEQNV